MFGTKKNIAYILIILMVFFSGNLKAQEEEDLEELIYKLSQEKKNTSRVELCLKISNLVVKKDSLLSFEYLEKAKKISRKIKSDIYLSLSYTNEGAYYRKHNEYINSEIAYNKAILIAKKIENDTILAIAYFEMGRFCNDKNDYTRSIEYHKKALELRKKYKNKKKIAESYNAIGLMHWRNGKYYNAESYYLESIKIKEELKDSLGLSMEYNNLGTVHMNITNYPVAFSYLLMSLEIAEKINNSKRFILATNNIGVIYRYRGDTEGALKIFREAYVLSKKDNNVQGVAYSLSNIGNIYADIGKHKEAISSFKEAIIYYNEIGYEIGTALKLRNIGDVYLKLKEPQKAMEYFNKSLAIVKKIDNKPHLSYVKYSIAKAYFDLKKNRLSEKEAEISLEIAKEADYKVLMESNHELLSKIAFINRNYKKAYWHLLEHNIVNEKRDSLLRDRQLLNAKIAYEVNKVKAKNVQDKRAKEKSEAKLKIAEAESEFQKKMGLVGGAFFIAISLLLVYTNNKRTLLIKSKKLLTQKNSEIEKKSTDLEETVSVLKKTQTQLIESEKMASLGNLVAGVAHEMNTPIGIGVQATSGIVNRSNQIISEIKLQKADKSNILEFIEHTYHSSKLALSNLQRTSELIKSFKLVSVDQSIEEKRKFNIKSYFLDILLSLKSKLKEQNVSVKIECEENLEIESYPGVFAQLLTNFVINSLVHAFVGKENGQILIKVEKENENYKMSYQDNGVGMTEEVCNNVFEPFFTTNKQTGTGLGMHIIYNLITQKLKGSIVCTTKINEGVTFNIFI